MKQFQAISFSEKQARRELKDFWTLLNDPARPELKEHDDILPFFTAHERLIALMGLYNPLIANPDRIATEFDIFGDHAADVAVGDSQSHQYCFIEYEDAASTSVCRKKRNRASLEWSDRFDHGCSPIIDWLLWLENPKNTQPYLQRFGVHANPAPLSRTAPPNLVWRMSARGIVRREPSPGLRRLGIAGDGLQMSDM